MTLHVDFERFADEARRHVKTPLAYLTRWDNRILATSADPATGAVVSASASLSLEDARRQLQDKGLEVAEGRWGEDAKAGTDSGTQLPFIAAVAYRSSDEMPGLWVDAFAEAPSQAMAIKALYDEFRDNGEIGELTLEEFVRLASPNVAIVSPAHIERFILAKSPCD